MTHSLLNLTEIKARKNPNKGVIKICRVNINAWLPCYKGLYFLNRNTIEHLRIINCTQNKHVFKHWGSTWNWLRFNSTYHMDQTYWSCSVVIVSINLYWACRQKMWSYYYQRNAYHMWCTHIHNKYTTTNSENLNKNSAPMHCGIAHFLIMRSVSRFGISPYQEICPDCWKEMNTT